MIGVLLMGEASADQDYSAELKQSSCCSCLHRVEAHFHPFTPSHLHSSIHARTMWEITSTHLKIAQANLSQQRWRFSFGKSSFLSLFYDTVLRFLTPHIHKEFLTWQYFMQAQEAAILALTENKNSLWTSLILFRLSSSGKTDQWLLEWTDFRHAVMIS